MHPVFRFLALHAAIGFALATVFVAAVVWFDPGGLATLLLRAEEHPLPLVLLWFFLGCSFGGVQIAIAVIQQGRE